MKFSSRFKMTRLKKKLLLYFILISIVSISVSAEIIFEMSSQRFRQSIQDNFSRQMALQVRPAQLEILKNNIDYDYVFSPLFNLRNRMILLLVVVSVSIIGAFFLFTKDIVSPMDGMVEATKKIAAGDLTVTVPVMSEDEIGQVASLINDMNVNLQDMIMQIRQEINRHLQQIIKASYKVGEIVREDVAESVMRDKKLSMRNYKNMMKFGREVVNILESMSDEMFALEKFVKMYKTYGSHTEILQKDIDKELRRYNEGVRDEEGE
jgi:methyl-accepting chemotaxis protein